MNILLRHEVQLAHHVNQGAEWLKQSDGGKRTAALSYAALEFRFAIERLAVHYWKTLLNRPLTVDDVKQLGTYKSLEHKLYKLGGHQKQIDGHFAFMRAVYRVLQVPAKLPTPHLGKLSAHWHECSELCHIAWPLGSGADIVREAMFAKLNEVHATLSPLIEEEFSGWPIIKDPEFAALRDRFVKGAASEIDVKLYARRNGLWGCICDQNGVHMRDIGVDIPPCAEGNGNSMSRVD